MDLLIRILAIAALGALAVYFFQLILAHFRQLKLAAASAEVERELLRERIGLLADQRKADRDRAANAWNGWRKFRVVSKKKECEDVFSFYLEPHDGKPLPPFSPGQYLTFQLTIPHQNKPVIRCYSLSDSPHNSEFYRVTIKRVPPPPNKQDAPPGLSSNYFHRDVQVGDILDVKAPSGHFYLKMDDARPVVLLSGGVGITPMVSMLGAICHSGARRETWFFHGTRNQTEHIQKRQLETLAAKHDFVRLHVCYSQPQSTERLGTDYHHAERLSVDLLKKLLPSNNYDFFICGPPPMMSSLTEGLRAWGVPDKHVFFEAFGPASVKRVSEPARAAAPAQEFKVSFSRAGRTSSWNPQATSLLEFAEEQGVSINSGCRAGNCGSCMVAVKSGETKYVQEPGFKADTGCCLTCIAVPITPVTLDA
jgi:ferredoxin-NADP reductase